MSKNEPFAPWQCPLCGEKLTGDSTLKCTKGHCFDRAKEGYWHLLPVQSMRTKAPGDSKEMVAARRAFLNAGYYGIFGKAVGELCAEYGQPASPEAALHLLDAGCGEGWYDRCIAQALAEKGRRVQLAGFDIAKPAVRLAAKALPTAQYAVASSFSQPVRTGWLKLDATAYCAVGRALAARRTAGFAISKPASCTRRPFSASACAMQRSYQPSPQPASSRCSAASGLAGWPYSAHSSPTALPKMP